MQWSKELQEYFKSQKVEVELYPSNVVMSFSSIEKFYGYYLLETDSWESENEVFTDIKTYFLNITETLLLSVTEEDLNKCIKHINESIDLAKAVKYPNIPYSSQLAVFLKDTCNKNEYNRALVKSLLMYLEDPNLITNFNYFLRNITNYTTLSKMLIIIEGGLQNLSEANSYVKSQEKLLSDVKANYSEAIIEITNEILEAKDQSKEIFQGINNYHDETKASITKHVESSLNELDKLEKLYSEKLKLEEPAKYWNEYEKERKCKGNNFLKYSLITGGIILGFSIFLLYQLPGLIRDDAVLKVENIIRWALITALIYSTFFYMLKLFVKLTLSNYHLASDAKERHQLTFQYLSLIQANAIDEKDKEIILQSLFSRADTGLLKGDSSPTMPDGILSQIVKNISG